MPIKGSSLFQFVTKYLHPQSRIVVAVSGGVDSCVLLHLCSMHFAPSSLLAVHINHQLQENADEMENFCYEYAKKLGISFVSQRLEVGINHSNLESRARTLRYQAFSKIISQHDVLLTAHHADDQVESVFLNLLRGSGIAGIRGIAKYVNQFNLHCLRPLLAISRHEILEYANTNKIEWVEDPSNIDQSFNRNYIRQSIFPLLKKRWPEVEESFSKVTQNAREAQNCLDDLASLDLKNCVEVSLFSPFSVLNIAKVNQLNQARKKNLLRYWVAQQGNHYLHFFDFDRIFNAINNPSGRSGKQYQYHGFRLAIYKNQLFYLYEEQSEAASLVSKKNVIHRKNYLENGYSPHFMKHAFQRYAVPPWMRDRVCFELNSNGKIKNLLIR